MDVSRSGWVKPVSGDHLPDRVSIGMLTRLFPPSVMDEVLRRVGRVERRKRLGVRWFSRIVVSIATGAWREAAR